MYVKSQRPDDSYNGFKLIISICIVLLFDVELIDRTQLVKVKVILGYKLFLSVIEDELPLINVRGNSIHLVNVSCSTQEPQVFHGLVNGFLNYLFVSCDQKSASIGRSVQDPEFENSFYLHEGHPERIVHLELPKFGFNSRIQSVLHYDSAQLLHPLVLPPDLTSLAPKTPYELHQVEPCINYVGLLCHLKSSFKLLQVGFHPEILEPRSFRIHLPHKIFSAVVFHSLRPAYHYRLIHGGPIEFGYFKVAHFEDLVLKLHGDLLKLCLHQPLILLKDLLNKVGGGQPEVPGVHGLRGCPGLKLKPYHVSQRRVTDQNTYLREFPVCVTCLCHLSQFRNLHPRPSLCNGRLAAACAFSPREPLGQS